MARTGHRENGGTTAAPGEATPRDAVAAAVHELNNPLFAILGIVELLLDDPELPPRSRERLELIRSSAYEVRDVGRSLLERSRHWTEERA
jgi:signal transduction histidine kinase